MSFKVLVIPEDFTKDEHILKPLVGQIMSEAGKPRAIVEVCRNPNFQGISECLKIERLRQEVILRYPMVDLFILFVDRDGKAGRKASVDNLSKNLFSDLNGRAFLGETAIEEVEIFLLAGHSLSAGWRWADVRSDPDVKDTYFKGLAEREGTRHLPHEGRKKLMAEAMLNWPRIKSRCPEEILGLIDRIRNLP